ncbi:MAG TPA: S41 family peptidase [Polyangiaceae bacterium]
MLNQLARVLVLVENEYVEPVDRQRLIEGSIKGMVAELDPHSSYLPPSDYSILLADTEGRFGGIGVEVDFTGELVTVIAPIEGSPADRGGVRPGDQIIAIDNRSVEGRSPNDLVRAMRGKPGSRVGLTLRHKGDDRLVTVTLTREVISVASVANKLLKGGVGYLRIKSFQSGTHTELLDALAKLRAQAKGNLQGVLLDLRNNPGGLVDEATAVADEFLSGGVIFTTRRRGKVVDEVRATRSGSLQSGPLVTLVNEYSASSAELVAGALQDNHRSTVVGAKTFGKGSVQSIVDLPGHAGLKLTTMRYYTPSGRTIQAQGIQPDVLVDSGYGADQGQNLTREEDLEHHLSPEGPRTASPRAVLRAPAGVERGAASEDTRLGVSRDIPVDPTQSRDFALSVAYQIVTGVQRRR